MSAVEDLATLEDLGADQWGLVTTGQARRFGVSPVSLGRLTANGHIARVRRGVYALPSSTHDKLLDLRAAWLATNPRATAEERVAGDVDVVVSHTSAASVHDIGDLLPSKHEFTATRRKQTVHDDLCFHRAALDKEDVAFVDGLPTTSLTRTLVDLGNRGTDWDHFATMTRDAMSRSNEDADAMAAHLDAVAARFGKPDGATVIKDSLASAGLPDAVERFSKSAAIGEAFVESLQRSGALKELVPTTLNPALAQLIEGHVAQTLQEQLAPMLTSLSTWQASTASGLHESLMPLLGRSLAPRQEPSGSSPPDIEEVAASEEE